MPALLHHLLPSASLAATGFGETSTSTATTSAAVDNFAVRSHPSSDNSPAPAPATSFIIGDALQVLKNKVVNNVNIKLNLPLPGGKEQPATPPSAQSSQLQSLLDEFLKYYNFAVKHLSVARESVEGRHLTPHAPCERAAEGGDTMKERGQHLKKAVLADKGKESALATVQGRLKNFSHIDVM
mmetsp:Transcript_25843/g.65159  ORF Transcript_25843/g.65159 Transcript_25843/m.65159 type:complete len:183 (-) Transcript_25843:244-792(-)